MTSNEINYFIKIRSGELSSDEILQVIDVSNNPQIDHITYDNNRWEMWDNAGAYFTFAKRNW